MSRFHEHLFDELIEVTEDGWLARHHLEGEEAPWRRRSDRSVGEPYAAHVVARARSRRIVVAVTMLLVATVAATIALGRHRGPGTENPVVVSTSAFSRAARTSLEQAFVRAKLALDEILPRDVDAIAMPRFVTSDGLDVARCPRRALEPRGWTCTPYRATVVHDRTLHRWWTIVAMTASPALSARARVSFDDGGNQMAAVSLDGVHFTATEVDLGVPLCEASLERRPGVPADVVRAFGLPRCISEHG